MDGAYTSIQVQVAVANLIHVKTVNMFPNFIFGIEKLFEG